MHDEVRAFIPWDAELEEFYTFMGHYILKPCLILLFLLSPACLAQQIERDKDGLPVAVTVDGVRYAVIPIEDKRQALKNEAEIDRLRREIEALNALVAAEKKRGDLAWETAQEYKQHYLGLRADMTRVMEAVDRLESLTPKPPKTFWGKAKRIVEHPLTHAVLTVLMSLMTRR